MEEGSMSWEMVKIPDVLFFLEGPGVRNSQFTNSGVKLLNVGNINNGQLDLETTSKFISEEEAYGKYKHFLVEEGDLLIASSGIVVDNFHNKITWAKAQDLPLCMNTSTIKFRSLDRSVLDIRYFSYFLKSKLFSAQLRKLITGSAQLNFGPSHLKQISLPLPPLPTQKRIAEILDAADALRRKDQELLKKYDELAQAIFIDMFGDPVKNEKGWELRRLGELFLNPVKCGPFGSALKREEYVSQGIPVWVMDNIQDYNFNENDCLYISSEKYDALKSYSASRGDIIISRAGTVGKMCVIDSGFDKSIISTNLIKLSLDERLLNPFFFVTMMKYFGKKIGRLRTGSENGFTHMNTGVLAGLEFALPTIQKQNNFIANLRNIKKETQTLGVKSEFFFNSLLQQAFNGELVP
jgi:type I restriction enzyme, S subunit